jgi:hypothetical protein
MLFKYILTSVHDRTEGERIFRRRTLGFYELMVTQTSRSVLDVLNYGYEEERGKS